MAVSPDTIANSIATLEAAEAARRNEAEELRHAVELADARIAEVYANPQLSQTEKEEIAGSLRAAKLTGSVRTIQTALTMSHHAVAAETGENARETAGRYVFAADRELDAAAQARVASRARNFNLDSPEGLRNFTESFVEENDTAFRKYRAENLAEAMERDPQLKAAAKEIATAPPAVLKQVYTTQEQDKAALQSLMQQAPDGSEEEKTFRRALRMHRSPAIHTALEEYERTKDMGKFTAEVEAERERFHRRGDESIERAARSGDRETREAAETAKRLGGSEAVEELEERMSPERLAAAKRNAVSGRQFASDSQAARDMAVVKIAGLTRDEYDIFETRTAAALTKSKGLSATKDFVREYDGADHARRTQITTELLMSDPTAHAYLMKLDEPRRAEIIKQYVTEIDTNQSHFNNVGGLNKGLSALLVREAAEERGVQLNGKNKVEVAGLLMSEGFTSIAKGNKEAADMWAEQVENALKRNGVTPVAAAGVGLALKGGSMVGTGITNAAASFQKGTMVEDGSRVVGNAINKAAVAFNLNGDIKSQLGTLDAKGWDDFQYKGKDGKMHNLFDDVNGKLTVDSIKAGLAKAGVKLDASFDKNGDGHLSGKELTDAMTLAVQRTKAQLQR